MNSRSLSRVVAVTILAVTVLHSVATARTLRLFVIGNSFSVNATRYLPDLAAAGGQELVLGTAETGGCSLERHWRGVEAFLANPDDPKAKIYHGKSLHELISTGTWDIVTLQQYSRHSADPATYRPYAEKLCAYLRSIQPGAEIVLHQTWAYRVDASRFGQISSGVFATNQREMWERSRAAYRQIARELGVRIIPVGDAFWNIDSDQRWGFRPDVGFAESSATYPALPDQSQSLHVGYHWTAEKKLKMDANHANTAGEYLGALVWFGVIFDQSPREISFAPVGIAPEFAERLRQVAADVVLDAAGANSEVSKLSLTPEVVDSR